MKIKRFFNDLAKCWPGLIYIVSFALFSPIMGLVNRPFGTVRNLASIVDSWIPFRAEFILTYHSWMPSLVILGLAFYYQAVKPLASPASLAAVQSSKDYQLYRDFCLCLLLGQALAHFSFPFFQTAVPRYQFSEAPQGLFEFLVAKTYAVDNQYCGFPSIHMLTSLLAIYFVFKSQFKTWVKALVAIHFSLIIASTMLVKQHVFWDFPGGFIYACIAFFCLPLNRRLANRLDQRMLRSQQPRG
ncbi:MAG: phosphatase PAP2 family protein [Eubacteriales bacterium]|nr:phosphatase PAP2 family protein [Eubacteriales bacterium]